MTLSERYVCAGATSGTVPDMSRCDRSRPRRIRPGRVESPDEAARVARVHWDFGGGGLLLARPPDRGLDDVEPLIEEALAEAERRRVTGQAVTPFVLSFLHERSEGRTLAANRELVVANAGLAAEVAVASAAA